MNFHFIEDDKVRSMIKQSWAISWPMSCIMFYEFMIGITDVYVAGKFGDVAQAAYGFAFQLYFVFIIIGIALSVGAVSIVSRLFTSGKKDGLGIAINTSVIISAVSGLALAVVGVFFSTTFVNFLNLPS
ncbi:MAG: MATE family efflux transporter, partial [Candidatus Omnitrophota bacterium]